VFIALTQVEGWKAGARHPIEASEHTRVGQAEINKHPLLRRRNEVEIDFADRTMFCQHPRHQQFLV